MDALQAGLEAGRAALDALQRRRAELTGLVQVREVDAAWTSISRGWLPPVPRTARSLIPSLYFPGLSISVCTYQAYIR